MIGAGGPAPTGIPALLDWPQLRVLLSEALGCVPAQAADRWERIADLVNARCPGSQPRSPKTFEKALAHVAATVAGASGLAEDPTPAPEVWTLLFYQRIRSLLHPHFAFLNFGYEGPLPEEAKRSLREEDEPSRAQIQLYQRLIGAVDLEGRKVLEVGCGWGGGCAYMASYLSPALLVGMDLVPSNVECCRERGLADRLRFAVGNALKLPFRSTSFDVVVNLESSHNYASFPEFAREVRRVLVPDGLLLFGDVRPGDAAWAETRRLLVDTGFAVDSECDVSAGVRRAMASQTPRKQQVLEASGLGDEERAGLSELMLLPGSKSYERLMAGGVPFRMFVLRKAGERAGAIPAR